MGEHANVGIEPPSQTVLIDATEKLPGVVCSGVPGAGGVDAIFAIVLSPGARIGVELMWSQWNSVDTSAAQVKNTVCPLLLKADASLQAGGGVRVESLAWD